MLDPARALAERKLGDGLQALGLAPEPGKAARLLEFLALLAKWNRTYNLTAIDDPLEMVSRHLLDSLSQLMPGFVRLDDVLQLLKRAPVDPADRL